MKNNYLFCLKLIIGLCIIGLSFGAFAQVTVSGTVTDAESGEGVPGVNVVVKGTSSGAVTGVDGNYRITVSEDATLVFSFVGYRTQEVVVGNQSVIDVALTPDVVELANIVVIGYGTVEKKDATGSVASIDTEDFNKGVTLSPQDLMMGRIPGVNITTNGGAPGAGSSIRIRGGSSLSASNSPLVVIDGVIMSDESISGLRNPLSLINPNDIASFTVLKDASATAIYGARASNGVIIITTKRGKIGQGIQVNYDANVSTNSLPQKLDVLNGNEYRALVNQRIAEGDPNIPASATSLLGSENTDWQEQVFGTSIGTEHNLSLTGSVENVPYRASVGYSNQDGILNKSNFTRTSASIGVDPYLLDDHLKVKINARGTVTKNNFSNEGAIGSAVFFDPTQPVRVAESPWGGFYYWPQTDNPSLPITIASTNPVALVELTDNTADVRSFIGNVELDYRFHFLPDLRADLNIATTRSETEGLRIESEDATWTYDPVNGNGTYNPYDERKRNDLLEFYLNYAREFEGASSQIDLVAGYSWQNFWREGSSLTMNAAQDFERSSSDFASENYLISFFGRLNYTFNDKYLLTFTLRRDGSSRFIGDNQWGTFPALALAWRISDEAFLQGVGTTLSDLKLRFGYGVTGQENIGSPYPALARVTEGDERAQYQFGNEYIYTIRYEGFDANLKWEETTTYNVGLDFGLLNNRITGTLDLYQRITEDLLNTIPVPIGTNFTNEILTNVGSLENKGIEFAINAGVIESNELNWDFGFNITRNINEITKLTNVEDPNYLGVFTGGISGGVGSTIQIHSVGYPKNSFFVYEQVYDENQDPVEGLYVDQNEDGIINDIDRVKYNDPDPDVFMGFSSHVNYNNWNFSFNARANLGNYVYNNVSSTAGVYQNLYYGVGYFNNVTADITEANFNIPQYFTDYYVHDASFFRMDNMTLGYDFGNSLSERINLNISLTAQNAFVITKYAGLDPEVNGGIDNNIFPRPRTFLLGLNVQFR